MGKIYRSRAARRPAIKRHLPLLIAGAALVALVALIWFTGKPVATEHRSACAALDGSYSTDGDTCTTPEHIVLPATILHEAGH